jgi:four helix bundle protein
MGVRQVEELRAYQHAKAFRLEVYALVRASHAASRDFKYRDQLFDAAAGVEMNIAEGWSSFVPGEIAQFLRYARASLHEAEKRLLDGVDRGYFTSDSCKKALRHADMCGGATVGLWKSLQPLIREARRSRKR